MTTSVTKICNRALQHLGAARILEITDDTKNGRACNAAYDAVRRAELRKHRWRFAITRVTLAPLAEVDPHEEFAYIFQIPGESLRILKPKNNPILDWQVEGRKIYTSLSDVMHLRYIVNEEDPNQFDDLFVEALALKMAHAMCEEITQSNTKKDILERLYDKEISEARKTNAMETIPAEPETDSWLLARI